MKKGCSGLIVVLVILAVLVIWGIKAYNSMVKQREAVNTAWSNVENTYQRRADLIPNLVSTVKGYAKHEQSTLEGVVEARAKATQIKVDPANLDEASLKKFNDAQGELGSALGKLLMIQENYPDLKANENFLELQSQLEGTENRINVARNNFNDTAKNYNTYLQKFPNNVISGLFGFKTKPYFEAAAGSETAPKVEF
ncbi:MAG: LemA family protein [Bacteroidales bacterium]|jgi:LemA protein|nr:LemA family protein [Bacteroidales bacterium]MCI1733152.1 LemA family protein [Bacteroidales bacterium]